MRSYSTSLNVRVKGPGNCDYCGGSPAIGYHEDSCPLNRRVARERSAGGTNVKNLTRHMTPRAFWKFIGELLK